MGLNNFCEKQLNYLNNETIIIEIKLILLLKSKENKCHYNKHMNLQPAPKQFLKKQYTMYM